jgi:hypothetical protein
MRSLRRSCASVDEVFGTLEQAARDFSPLPTAYPGRELTAQKRPGPSGEKTPRMAAVEVVPRGPSMWTPSQEQAPPRPVVEDSPYIPQRVPDRLPLLPGSSPRGY